MGALTKPDLLPDQPPNAPHPVIDPLPLPSALSQHRGINHRVTRQPPRVHPYERDTDRPVTSSLVSVPHLPASGASINIHRF